MNYEWHYNQLMLTRKNRVLEKEVYREKHHIIPRSMGGSDEKENLVELTAREHFIAHWLLWRIHRNQKMAFAFYSMQKYKNGTHERKIFSSIAYEESKIERSKLISENNKKYKTGHIKTPETLKRMSESMKGVKKTKEHCEKIAKALSGKSKSDSHRKNLSVSLQGYVWSKERNNRIAIKNSGENNGRAKKTIQLQDGKILNSFSTFKEALAYVNTISDKIISKTTFFRRVSQSKECCGFIWKFSE